MKKTKAFTLIELLVVITIIGLLASIVLAALNSSKEGARLAAIKQFSASIYHSLGNNIIAYWNFNNDTTSSSIDVSGNGNNCNWTSNASFLDESIDGKAASFNSQYCQESDNPKLNLSGGAVTIEFWVKKNGTSMCDGSCYFISRKIGGITSYLISADNAKRGYFNITAGTDYTYVLDNFLNRFDDNKWHHMVFVFDSSSGSKNGIYLYFDAAKSKLFGPVSGNIVNIGDLSIGQSFNALFDNVRIYDSALSQSEIQKYYAYGLYKTKGEELAQK